jgi:hypothetical protein
MPLSLSLIGIRTVPCTSTTSLPLTLRTVMKRFTGLSRTVIAFPRPRDPIRDPLCGCVRVLDATPKAASIRVTSEEDRFRQGKEGKINRVFAAGTVSLPGPRLTPNVEFRKQVVEKVGLGFELPSEKAVIGPNGPQLEVGPVVPLNSPLTTMVPRVLPLIMVEVREYLDRSGHSPFAAWSDRLNREAAAKVAAALARIQQGNSSNAKGVGAGAYEYRIDFGPGYRV